MVSRTELYTRQLLYRLACFPDESPAWTKLLVHCCVMSVHSYEDHGIFFTFSYSHSYHAA